MRNCRRTIMKICRIYIENSLKHQRKSRQNKKNRFSSSKIRLRCYIVDFIIDFKAKNVMYIFLLGKKQKNILDIWEAQNWPKWLNLAQFGHFRSACILKILISSQTPLHITFRNLPSIIKSTIYHLSLIFKEENLLLLFCRLFLWCFNEFSL